ncbi:type IV toxin-antitoxin system AbiEi family antitoxin [Pseudoflavitalea rhizosphaerae]|uniref:type IV toxin-antitoxin system AbiEi family antitoxin n=1 Tax=Pseudoflavitalea rhizosphaerae TaxID=1884793 RepID=UPI000F8EB645|nr:type IV toxin-antitoxin system AbiEi family antitoxin [Pseudoflavitalea rhizosphaerae]
MRKDQVLPIIERFGRDKENYLLVARYIPQPIKEYFVKVGINYLESAGNCSIKAPGLLLYISDQKVTPVREAIPGKLWKRTGLKFLLAIIEQPKLLNAPYREVVEAADIAVWNIGQLKEELHKEEYVKIIDGEMILINHDVLISRWSGIYGATMRPRLKGGFYRFLRSADQEAWETFTIYVDYENNDIIKKHRIVPDMEGEIIVLEKFWGILPPSIAFNDIPAPANVAPALVVYTDLANSFDSRNHEIANSPKLRERILGILDEKTTDAYWPALSAGIHDVPAT